jgi:predicted nucleic acid-binding protein
MPVRVVDASALGALICGEPRANEVAQALTGATLVAPSLLWYELASICLKKIRRHPETARRVLAAHRLAGRMSIGAVAVEHPAVVRMASRMGLSTYDTSYLWLARKLGAKLVTLDARLARVAAGAAFPM